jgi:hypothetical protein
MLWYLKSHGSFFAVNTSLIFRILHPELRVCSELVFSAKFEQFWLVLCMQVRENLCMVLIMSECIASLCIFVTLFWQKFSFTKLPPITSWYNLHCYPKTLHQYPKFTCKRKHTCKHKKCRTKLVLHLGGSTSVFITKVYEDA